MDTKIGLKLKFQDDFRRVSVASTFTFDELSHQIRTLFRLEENSPIIVKYIDDENDACTVSSDEELNEAKRTTVNGVLRLVISQPAPPVKKEPEPQTRTCPVWAPRCFRPHPFHDGRVLETRALGLMQTDPAAAREVFIEQLKLSPPWGKRTPLYNIACCDSLLGNIDSALAFLARSIDAGFKDVKHMQNDADLNNIKHTGAFKILLADLEEAAAPKEAPNQAPQLYNLACLQALLGNVSGALTLLDKAVDAGFMRFKHMLNNPDLAALADIEEFKKIADRALQNFQAASQKPVPRRPTKDTPQPKAKPSKRCAVQRRVPVAEQKPLEEEAPAPAAFPVPEPVVAQPEPEPSPVEVPAPEVVAPLPEPVIPEVPAPQPEVPAAQPLFAFPESLKVLEEMGFIDRIANCKALMKSFGDVNGAINFLLA